MLSHHSSVFEKVGSTSKITPRNGYLRWRTTWPIVNFAFACNIPKLTILTIFYHESTDPIDNVSYFEGLIASNFKEIVGATFRNSFTNCSAGFPFGVDWRGLGKVGV